METADARRDASVMGTRGPVVADKGVLKHKLPKKSKRKKRKSEDTAVEEESSASKRSGIGARPTEIKSKAGRAAWSRMQRYMDWLKPADRDCARQYARLCEMLEEAEGLREKAAVERLIKDVLGDLGANPKQRTHRESAETNEGPADPLTEKHFAPR